ncbi:Gfo/Idh/MocA family protein [Falsiroseomonas oryzae]|uniref:Gfo/Idh/MocA family protein n=1 Tax=Falsiroseomonas oryzae TaxID=2766473 RepID=UPI0022EAD0B4|nr:Gfo/Idh/MocA family oxidoreductase [Roseomonas sp. MO-31]
MTLRVGIIGCGYFAQFHRDAWSRLPVRVAAICDSDRAKAETAAQAFPGAQVFTDAAAMLDSAQPQLVDIVTPPGTHADLVALCAERRVPAICQKPLAPDWPTAQRIVEMAERAHATLIVHENFRFMPWFMEAERLIRDGAVGEPLDIGFRLRSGDGQGEDAYLARQPYFRTMPRFLVHETVIHLIDVFRFLFGEVAGVFARLRRLNPAIVGEDAATVLFAFADPRRQGIVDGNRLVDHPSDDPRMTNGVLLVEGTGGQLRVDGYGRLFLRPHRGEEREHAYAWENRGYGGDCVFRQCRAALAHIANGAPVPNTARAWLRNMEIEEAIYRSAEEGRFVTV